MIERHAALQSPSRIEELVKVFIHATKVSLSDIFSGALLLTPFQDGNRVLGHGFRAFVEAHTIELW